QSGAPVPLSPAHGLPGLYAGGTLSHCPAHVPRAAVPAVHRGGLAAGAAPPAAGPRWAVQRQCPLCAQSHRAGHPAPSAAPGGTAEPLPGRPPHFGGQRRLGSRAGRRLWGWPPQRGGPSVKRCIIVGRPNVGKTMFALQFALYLGLVEARIAFAEAGGRRWERAFSVETALADLTGAEPHRTRQLQTLRLELPARKGRRELELVDTSGLVDGIHPDAALRRAMAQTLAAVREAHMILHMIDAALAGGTDARQAIGCGDFEVARKDRSRGGYQMSANS